MPIRGGQGLDEILLLNTLQAGPCKNQRIPIIISLIKAILRILKGILDAQTLHLTLILTHLWITYAICNMCQKQHFQHFIINVIGC